MTDYRFPIHQESTLTDSLRDPDLEALHIYWVSLQRGAAIPLRVDFDPMRFPRLLENIILFNVDGANSYTVRIVGEAVKEVVGQNTTGKPAGSVMNEAAADSLIEVLSAVVTEGAPKFRAGALFWRDEAKSPGNSSCAFCRCRAKAPRST